MTLEIKSPKNYLCYRAATPLVIDGTLNAAVWQNAPWTDLFVDIEGDARPTPPLRTRAKMLWDDACFYIGAQLEEPHIWASLTEHDSVIYQDNDFEIFIDPDGDNHNYYEIEINALNTVWDLRLEKPYRDGGVGLNEWEIPGLKTAVHIDGTLNDATDIDQSWSVVLAIPWNALRQYAGRAVPPQNGDQWRVNFSRVEWDVEIKDGAYHKIPGRPEHNWVWSPQGAIDMHRPERWGYVQFTTAAPGTATFQPDAAAHARDYLMKVYDAQHNYKRRHGRWATTFQELAISPHAAADEANRPMLHVDDEDFEASVCYTMPDNVKHRLQVRADSRLLSTRLGE